MNTQGSSLKSVATSMLVAISAFVAPTAHAQTPANADAAYKGYLSAYLYSSGGKTYFTNSLTDRSAAFMWGQAYEITGVEDAYDRNPSADRQQLISDLLNTFETQNHADLSWDSWNDDTAWATIGLARGYRITGNVDYLNDTKQAWDMAYSRGWDDTYGGGIWENMDNVPSGGKCTLSNVSFVPAAIIIYQATGDATYLTKAEAIYAWTRSNLMDATGEVNEQIGPSGEARDSNVYNSGLMLNAAAILYRITGKQQYHDDAVLLAGYQIQRHAIMDVDYPNNGPFGADQFFRGLSNFARWNGLWSNYSQWLLNNASAAWKTRRTDFNISQDDISAQTPPAPANLASMESETSMVLQQVTEIEDIAVPPAFAGEYQLQNANSNLAIAVSGGSTASGAAVVQEAFTGGSEALWTITPTSGGYYQITNVNSGLALEVEDASAVSGANIVQLPAHGMRPGDDQWMPVLNADGTYTFFNLDSQQVLDAPHQSTMPGTQLDQWFANGGTWQAFRLIVETDAASPATNVLPDGSTGPADGGATGAADATVGNGDASTDDGGVPTTDGGSTGTSPTHPSSESSGGCGCRTVPGPGSGGASLASLMALLALRRRARHGRGTGPRTGDGL